MGEADEIGAGDRISERPSGRLGRTQAEKYKQLSAFNSGHGWPKVLGALIGSSLRADYPRQGVVEKRDIVAVVAAAYAASFAWTRNAFLSIANSANASSSPTSRCEGSPRPA
jgi:hypothetical protein